MTVSIKYGVFKRGKEVRDLCIGDFFLNTLEELFSIVAFEYEDNRITVFNWCTKTCRIISLDAYATPVDVTINVEQTT